MDLDYELNLFSNFVGQETAACLITKKGPSILHIHNKSPNKSSVTLGLLALVHGNEYIGLPLLNSLLKSILSGEIELRSDIFVALGNVPAALQNKRFVDEDLNRCFGKSQSDSIESLRARELETLMLNHCDFVVDLHQTVSPAEKPFFIFQYASERCLAIIQKWNPGIPVVLQQDQIGENTGLSTDEYLRSLGKFGTALELGQLGTSEYRELGLSICKNILQVTTSDILKPPQGPLATMEFPVLKFQGGYKVNDSTSKLDDGWKNLQSFTEEQRLGTNENGIITAKTSGFMLFPRYRTVSAGQELYYYCSHT